MSLARELCDDIVGLAEEHEKNGDVLDNVCVLRVVENEEGLRVEEEAVFVKEYSVQEQGLAGVDNVLAAAKQACEEVNNGVSGKEGIDYEK